jgi:P pilus assembly chaperone PapD
MATPVSVTPTTISLAPGNTSELVTLSNESDTATRFEISVSAWTESEDGKTSLAPTNDLVLFPALLDLPARGSKKIRLGAEHAAAGVEKNYRLTIHELPQPSAAPGQFQIQVLTNMTLPVFIAAPGEQAKIAIVQPTVDHDVLSFTVANPGSAHFVLQTVSVAGSGAGGEAFNIAQKGWYVLAGGRRTYHIALGKDACKATAAVIKTVTDTASIGPGGEMRVPIPPGSCGEGATKFVESRTSEPAQP